MVSPRALIEMVVEGAGQSRRDIETVRDALRGMNNESLQRISSQMSDLGDRYSSLQSTIGNVASFAVAGLSLATLGTKVKGVLDSMAELDDLSQKIGSSVETLSRIQQVAKAFGVDFAGSVDPVLVKFALGLSTINEKSSKTAKALAAIGVSAKDSVGNLRDPGEVMIDAVKSLQNYEDGVGKAAVVNDLFGESGAKLIPFFNDMAENVDKFRGVAKETVGQATALQDTFGKLGKRTDEVFVAVTTVALPAISGLAEGFSDVLEAENSLTKNGEIAEWASMAAMGIARVADVAVLAVRGFSAISSSVGVITSDLEVLWTASPARMAASLAKGGSPLAELKAVIAERNKVLEAANTKWSDFYNADGNRFEQAVQKRLSTKVSDLKPVTPSPDGNKGSKDKGNLDGYGAGSAAATKAVNGQADAYKNLSAAIQGKIAKSNLELSATAPLSASQQEQIELTQQLAAAKDKLTPMHVISIENQIKERVSLLELIESNGRAKEGLASYNKARAEYVTAAAKTIQDAVTEAERNEELARAFGRTRGEIEALNLARLEDQLARRESSQMDIDDIANLEKLIDAKKRSSIALSQIDTMEAGRKAAESLDEFLDPSRAQSFGEALRESFGGAGTALSALSSSLDGYSRRQAEFDEQRENARLALASGQKTELQYMRDMSRLSELETRNRLSGYGDMANAAAGFFGEQSRGYQALMTVSKVFHAAELAMTLAELVPKGIAAVLNQGNGDPYSAFGRMAAMAAVVAGLGVAIGGVSGGSSVSLSESRQKEQGTGTVLGSDAKSGSIARALAEIEQATQDTYGVNTDMLISLRNIESGIGQFASLLVRTTGVTGDFGSEMNKGAFDSKGIGLAGAAGGGVLGAMGGAYVGMGSSQIGLLLGGPVGMALGAALGAVIGKTFIGKALGSVFGGKQSVEDTGFTVGKTDFASIFGGQLNAMQYADIKKDGGWFRSDKYNTQTAGLGEEGNRQITGVLTSLYDTVKAAGTMLGLNTDAFSAQLSSFVVDIGKVSLKGLSDDQIQEELQGVFSKVGDQLAEFGVGGLDKFQQVGEGYLETLARVSSNYASLDAIMQSIGTTVGTTGIASLDARERLVTMSGGISALAKQADSFGQNFLTEAERLAPVQKYVTDQLAGMNLAWVDTRDEFKNVTLGIDKTSEAGARQFTVMMSLAEAFAEVYPAAEDLTKSMKEIADERKGLRDQLDQLTMTPAQLADKARANIDISNHALFDEVQAAELARNARTLEIQIMGMSGDKAGELAAIRAQELAGMNPLLQAAQQRIYGLQDEAAALQLSNQSRTLDAQILELLGDKSGALTIQRELELAGMDPTLRASQRRIYSLQDEAAALETSNALLDVQAQIYELTGNKAGAASVRAFQQANALAALDPALRGATQTLWDLQAAATAVDKVKADAEALVGSVDSSYATLQKIVDRERKATQVEIDERTKSVAKIKTISDALRTTIDGMRGPGAAAMERTRAQSDLRSFLATARASGLLPDSTKLQAVLGVLTQDASEQFASFADYQADFYTTKNTMADLASISDAALSTEERALDALQDQLDSYDLMLEREQQQIDELKGISTVGMSIQQAIQAFHSAMLGAKSNPLNSSIAEIGKAYQSTLGRAPDAAGLEYWTGRAAAGSTIGDIVGAIGNSSEAKIKALYQSTLGRPADAAGLQYWMDRVAAGTSYATIEQGIKESSEYKKHAKIPGYEAGGDHGGGWRIVGENGPELEATGPARIFNASQTRDLMARFASPVDNSAALAAEVRQLREQNVIKDGQLERALLAIAKHTMMTADLLDRWETIGPPKERTT